MNSLPELVGNVKDVAEANAIREVKIRELGRFIRAADKHTRDLSKLANDTIRSVAESRWWIERRHSGVKTIIREQITIDE